MSSACPVANLEEQAAKFGGAAGSWLDPCYHQACDTFRTVVYEPSLDADGLEEGQEAADAALMHGNGAKGLGQLADGAAYATWKLARSRSLLVGPAEARAARKARARRSFKRAARRAVITPAVQGRTRYPLTGRERESGKRAACGPPSLIADYRSPKDDDLRRKA